ncbi:MAG: NHLP bacteriocin export ABC transporter permease/ATPase subunit [Microscillaceae bacterium]|nr:NHLP bacteriocin export ABC transporter permease/ATPase subunit [Microscillaceae bacterium]
MEALFNLIRQTGSQVLLTVNNPILLDDPQKIWWVDSGNLSIYTVWLPEGIPSGKRYFFTAIESEQIMMGFHSQDSPTGIGLLADAMEESILYSLDIEQFRSFLQTESLQNAVADLVAQWIDNIFFGISENANHPNQPANVLIQAGERLILRQEDSIASQKNVVWAKVAANKMDSILINGKIKLHNEGQEILIPLTRRSFFESTRNVGMRFVDTKEALLEEVGWLGLRKIDTIVLELERDEIQLIEEQAQTLLQKKYEAQFQKINAGLQQAQAILNPQRINKYAESIRIETDDMLFKAAQVVAAHQEIQLTPALNQNSPDALGDIIRASRIRYREVKLDGYWFVSDAGALLGFWHETETPIAIMPINQRDYEIYDPITQETIAVTPEVAQKVDKLAYTFYKPFPEKPITIGDIFTFGIFKDTKDFYWLILAGICITLLGMFTPILTGVLFDEVIPNASDWQVIQVGVALSVALFGMVLFEITESYALLRIESKLDLRVQAAVWDRLLSLPVTFYRQFNTGDLADRAMGIGEIHKILSGVVITTILGSVFSLLNFFLLFYYSVRLALVVLLLVSLQVLLIYLLGRRQINREKIALMYQGKTQGIALQMLNGISKFRVTGTEIRAFTHWLNSFVKMKQAAFKASQWQNTQMVFNSVAPLLASAILYYTLMQSTDYQTISTGEFLAFIAAYGSFTAAVLAMSGALLTIYQIFPIYERTRPILEKMPEIDSLKANPGRLKGKIEVSQINFRYESDAPLTLQDVSFKLNAGDYVAFVGPSGSGKSTMVRLLLGFEKAETGTIFFDEQELNQLDLRLLRRQIGTVLQDGQLTPGDIFSNIVGSSPQLTLDDAWEAAKLAALDEDIKQMPMGMHTVINEGGTTLSGGQRQRLLIAQVLVHKPRIIIFDEATSALDNRTQAIVTYSLNKLQATRIVIAHRLSTIQNVDKIFVFDKGRIVQSGTYQELLNQDGLFKDLAARQME